MNTDQPAKEYYIERLTADNLADVEKLHTAVYGRIPAHNFFFLKYDTHFKAIKYAGFIAYNMQQIPIGYYGVIPCLMKFEDRIVLVAQSADTMTHPQYRLKGLFTELAQLTYTLCKEAGICLLFGFPNQNSLPGFINKLGWETTERMDCFMIPTGASKWISVLNKLPLIRSVFNIYKQWELKNYNIIQQGMANSVFEDGYAGVYRDAHYLNYKVYTGNQVIRIGNSILWLKIGREIIIGDAVVAANDFEDMLYGLKRLARKLGINTIQFHTSPHTVLHALFLKHYLPIPSFPVIFKGFEGGLPLEKIKFTFADIDIF